MTVLSPPKRPADLAPADRRRGPIVAQASRYLGAVCGIGLAVLSLAALFISESSGLFGFVEHGYRMAIVVAIAVEVAATVLLIVFLLVNGTGLRTIRTSSP